MKSEDIGGLNKALARCNAGDREGCDALYTGLFRTFWGILTRLVRTWGEATWHDAEDAVANLFLSLYQRALDG